MSPTQSYLKLISQAPAIVWRFKLELFLAFNSKIGNTVMAEMNRAKKKKKRTFKAEQNCQLHQKTLSAS